jgi:hypothetical protein
MRLRDLGKMTQINKGNRSLFESVMVPEVSQALKDWIKGTQSNGVLIGGLALSFYVKPRYTQDVDVLFLDSAEIPNTVSGFKRVRPHAFRHDQTHVEVELVTPELISVSEELCAQVVLDAETHSGILVASPSGIVALKLGRAILNKPASYQDRADIVNLIATGRVNLDEFDLPDEQIEFYNQLRMSLS